MGSPPWLVVGSVFVAIGVLSCLAMALDLVRGYGQHMAIMNWVWPITGLYWGPLAVYFYFRRGRQMTHRWAREHGMDMEQMMSSEDEDPSGYWAFARKNWWATSKGISHCGAGCTLGDICGEWIVYLTVDNRHLRQPGREQRDGDTSRTSRWRGRSGSSSSTSQSCPCPMTSAGSKGSAPRSRPTRPRSSASRSASSATWRSITSSSGSRRSASPGKAVALVLALR